MSDGTILIEDARIGFRNFAGVEKQYNREGDRNFVIFLDDKFAQQLADDGWNIKQTREREVDEEVVPGEPYLQVSIGYKVRPPRIVMIGGSSGNRTEMTEDLLVLLDDMEIQNCDVIIRPYHWDVSGKQGIKAYLSTMYITIVENYLDLKYSGADIDG